MATAMTSRERMIAAIRREPVDYVPCCGSFNPLYPVQRRGHTWNFPWAEDASLEESVAYQVGELGLDELVHISVDPTAPADGVSSRSWVEDSVLHKVYTTPAGELRAAVRYDDKWPHGEDIPFYSDFNVGHFVRPWLQTEADLECLKLVQSPRTVGQIVDAARDGVAEATSVARRYGLALCSRGGLGLTGAQHLFGARELCLAAIEQPELVEAYLEHDHQTNLRTIAALGELGCDIAIRNGFYETADFYSPAMLERYLARRLNAEAEAIRDAGMVSAYTVHTGVMPILDHLAALRMDSLNGIDLAFHGVDPVQVRDKLSPTKALWTGPSSTYHIWQGPEATRQAVRQVFETFGRTGLILTQCVSSHSIMPWESTLAMVEEWKRLR
ncbi:MAG: hypothetical protein HPY69_12620 [Armatimonadetes bacterium]|nr:hypothetical protein [Armatimonadota bacterium]